MKPLHRSVSLTFAILFIIGLAGCEMPGFKQPTATLRVREPTATAESLPSPILGITTTPLPQETITPTEVPTPASSGPGQIAYISGGNVWRYLISDNQSIQVTVDGVAGDSTLRYQNPQFSPDGHTLAYTKNGVSSLLNLGSGDVLDLSGYGSFFRWAASSAKFFTTRGDFTCPSVEDLDDQVLINFDVMRYDLANLENPEILANVGGGLKFLTAISSDGQWAGVVNCGCYSECGSVNLWHLPTASVITMPNELYAGNLDFSPDATQVTLSQQQMFGYTQSPLYVAAVDLYGMNAIFEEANVAPTLALWSPDGEWIAFTAISFAADSMEVTDSRVILIHPDGSNMIVVESGFAELVDWSPDSNMLLYKQTSSTIETFYSYDLPNGTKTPVPLIVDPYSSKEIDWGRLP